MKNRLYTERSFARTRGNPYYQLPSSSSHRRVKTESSDVLRLSRRSDHNKCQTKYGKSADITLDSLNNINIAVFRDQVVQTHGQSILPFLNSLRHRETGKMLALRVQPFEVASKQTCNTKVPKRISDLVQSQKLNDLQHLWMGNCSLSNKLTVDYDCTLRQYGEQKKTPGFRYLAGRVRYQSTLEPPNYDQEQVVCDKFRRSLKRK